MANLSGLYAVSIEVACDTEVGGATLHLDLVVHADDGRVYGRGRITQALEWPNNDRAIHSVTGQIRHTGAPKDQLLVALSGEYSLHTAPWLEIDCPMTAALVLDSSWNGVGSFTYGLSGRQSCGSATVTKTGPE